MFPNQIVFVMSFDHDAFIAEVYDVVRQIPAGRVLSYGRVAELAGWPNHSRAVGRAMKDSVAEPYRKPFIPGFDELREKILAAGSMAMNISGSGPSVFSLSDNREIANKAKEIMKEHFTSKGIGCDVYVVKVTNKGAKLLAQ